MNIDGPCIYVTKWCDYSQKYGMGYQLSNESVGVWFNDNTKLVQDSNYKMHYFERNKQLKQEPALSFMPEDVNQQAPQCKKKVMIQQKFREWIVGETSVHQQPVDECYPDSSQCYVKKWMKTEHAAVFRLSNNVI